MKFFNLGKIKTTYKNSKGEEKEATSAYDVLVFKGESFTLNDDLPIDISKYEGSLYLKEPILNHELFINHSEVKKSQRDRYIYRRTKNKRIAKKVFKRLFKVEIY